MTRDPARGSSLLDLVLPTDRDLISYCEVGEELSDGHHNIIRLTVNSYHGFQDNKMMIPSFPLPNSDKYVVISTK